MNVLSLFDGISCGRVSLERGGHRVHKYFASEIDKYAISISQKNYPDIIQLGNIEKWREWDIDLASINLLLAGSPCQGFSFAGKGLNFEDPRSKLFFVFVDIFRHIKKLNPDVKFLLENVRMKGEHELAITRTLDTLPIYINSALVSAQNRNRIYWTNILGGGFLEEISQPEDMGILLQDILESGTADKIKSNPILAQYHKVNAKSGLKRYHEKHIGQLVRIGNIGKGGQGNRIVSPMGKSYALSAESSGRAGGGGSLIPTTTGWRKLSPIECERLQTIPDNYTEGISKSRRYHALGNAWTVDVIVHILKGLKGTR